MRLSMPTTSSPRLSRICATCVPINPAVPVSRIIIVGPPEWRRFMHPPFYNPVMSSLRLLFDLSLFRLALLLAAPLIPLRLLWRGRREHGYLKHWGERLALGPAPVTDALWIHAVSVGEMRAAQPLVQALRDAHPDAPLLLTCMTPTGRATAESLYGSFARIVYLPYDYAGSMRRFMRRA